MIVLKLALSLGAFFLAHHLAGTDGIICAWIGACAVIVNMMMPVR